MITRDLSVKFTCDRCGASVSTESQLLPEGWSSLTVSTSLGTVTYQIGPECLLGLNSRSPLTTWWNTWNSRGETWGPKIESPVLPTIIPPVISTTSTAGIA